MAYTTIRAEASDEFTEKRSRFIGHILPVQEEKDAAGYIDSLRRTYWDASHNVYAYILRKGMERYSDDGEPQGSAGQPVLEVLRREGLTDVCAVVTRYFGGILLGGGGLARAYTHGAKLAVDAAQRRTLYECVTLAFTADYTLYGKLARLLPAAGAKTIESDFAETVRLTVRLRRERREALEADLREISAGMITPVCLDECFDEISDE